MSSKFAEEYESKQTVDCVICAGRFVPGGTKEPLPPGVCMWCHFRGRLEQRYFLLWGLVQAFKQDHPDDGCRNCLLFDSVTRVMSARMLASEQTALRGQEGN